MARSPDSLVPSEDGQPSAEKRDDKAPTCRQGGEANPRAATQVNAAASSTPPAIRPIQLEIFPGRACPLKAKPEMGAEGSDRHGLEKPRAAEETKAAPAPEASDIRIHRDGVEGGSTRRRRIKATGETLPGPAADSQSEPQSGREAHKGRTRKRRNDAEQGVGGGHSTGEPRENRGEGRAAASTTRSKRGKTAGLPPKGKAQPRPKSRQRKPPARTDKVRKLQRTLCRVAKSQSERRFLLLYDKVCRRDVLQEAWRRVKTNRGAAGVDEIDIEAIRAYGEERFLDELQAELLEDRYRVSLVRRVHIPKPGQPGKTRPLGIPTVKDRVVQMAVKIVIEPLFEADFRPCSYGFRPKKTPRMALAAIVQSIHEGYDHVVDVDLRSYFDTIDHDLLMGLVARRVGDVRILRLIRAWLKAGVMEEGKVTYPDRGSPQGGVISPLLSNIFLHEVDRRWSHPEGGSVVANARLVRYADDMVILTRGAEDAAAAWRDLQGQFAALHLVVNEEKSRLTTVHEGFAFLGFEFRVLRRTLYLWPRTKAKKHIAERVRQTVRSVPSSLPLEAVIRKLNPVLWGWCTYFRIGNSNRVFHEVDWKVRSEVQLWLRRKHQCSWPCAKKRWNFAFLHGRCRLYRMVGKVSHLEGLRRTPPKEGGRRAG